MEAKPRKQISNWMQWKYVQIVLHIKTTSQNWENTFGDIDKHIFFSLITKNQQKSLIVR